MRKVFAMVEKIFGEEKSAENTTRKSITFLDDSCMVISCIRIQYKEKKNRFNVGKSKHMFNKHVLITTEFSAVIVEG